ncbi:ATP-dependent helicase [Phytophthora fragariae]|uniref:ATP-dependent helicase n=1 Tax=Phytophthora fragariae TaxID=53985 RepID=A0A6A3TU57_9STRA|nr:ATP-dependent helicase [Phytophthora fragariae]KAE9109010.1 ATP-dependent helicase [Phytophthora fragariae]KAE9142315.1 ATP-dependent helicase [Phytophthora fragariae]KAE9205550.1 ATP-dependent helicase [Phytophthora fragariae]KAE9224029.1 ATP-dependent helicase [Phytophthora fragariae]
MARLRSQQQQKQQQAAASEDSDADVCAVCAEQSQRVTVSCAACAKRFHLSCLSPPLRRRPQLADAWQCPDCNAGATGKRKQREETAEDEAKQEQEQPAPKRRRVVKKSKEDEEDDEPIAKTLPKRPNGKAAIKKKMTTKPQPQPSAAKSRDGRTGRRASSRKVVAQSSDEEEEDSDFVGESVSEGDEEEEEDESVLGKVEDARRPARRPTGVRKSPAKPKTAGNARAKQRVSPAVVAPEVAASSNAHVSDADSLDIEFVGESDESEDEDEEDAYGGPRYFIEYAANGRAKCKSCEQKLLASQLRVGISIRHSIFGDTTYYKHLECTAIGLKAGLEANKPKEENPDTEEVGEKPTKKQKKKKKDDPIEGLSKLKPVDQTRAREYMERNDLEGVIDERLELSDDHFVKKGRMPEKDPSKFLTATLLPYQREALAWMVGQEESSYKGGILADEMGMGKTIQAISLMLENIREEGPSTSGKTAKGRKSSTVRGGTLVICPLVAVMQWKSEIERFVEPGHLSVYIHHGNKRLDSIEKIASYDIVLTTYSIIESEIRKTLGWSKVACKYCGKKYLPDKLITHNKYFCGPDAKKTALQDKQQRKKPKKKAAGESSDEEDDDDLKKPVQKPRGRATPRSKKKDVDEKKPTLQKAKGKSPLHQIHWTRIVLDEAHYIKDRNCNTARSVFELKSTYKWCLSGTPLQNRIGELFSLVRFIQVKKYAYYHCNVCDCQMLDYNFPDKKCAQCTHSAIQHYSYFNKKVVIPIQAYGYVAEGKLAIQRLQNDVLQHILLRRTKEGRADDISLPPKLVRIRKDRLDERENDFYEAIYTQSQAQFNTYVSSGTLLNNYAHIFDLLIRLRQAVDHPYLVIYSKSNPALQLPSSAAPLVEEQPFDTNAGSSPEDERLCTICHEYLEDGVTAKCEHEFCRECVKEFIESLPAGGEATCPTCSKPLTVDLSPPAETNMGNIGNEAANASSCRSPKAVSLSSFHRNSILHRISDINAFQSSTKIEALMQELELMRVRDPSGKAIIFSQFVNMLDIIQHRLQLGGVKCVKLSGNMSMAVRDRTIKAFRDDPTVTAFLISLKAGGVALNLTVASHIFLMDPWWNPAAENQAIDRTHRLGQFKPIQATRFIIAGTVEERILKLQEKKQLIFEGTVGANVSAICRLTEEDLRFLFAT